MNILLKRARLNISQTRTCDYYYCDDNSWQKDEKRSKDRNGRKERGGKRNGKQI